MFHGILGYLHSARNSRGKTRNLELRPRFCTLFYVEATNQFMPEQIAPVDPQQPETYKPTPNNPPWNSWVAFGMWLLSVFLIVLVQLIFLVPYIAVSGVPFDDGEKVTQFGQTDPTAIMLQLLAIIPAHLITLVAAWFFVTRFRNYSFREMLGWQSGGIRWFHYIFILVAFFAFAFVLEHFLPAQENDFIRILRSSRAALFIVAFMATFTAPLVEEVIYRGLLYSAFQRSMGTWPAVALVTLVFTLVHVPQYYESVSTIIMLTLLSLTLTLVRVYTGNLLPCIILHTIFNGFQAILLVFEPYLERFKEPVEQVGAFLTF